MKVRVGPRGCRRASATIAVTALPLAAAALLGWAVDTPLRAVRQPGPAPVDQLVTLGAAALCGTLLATFALGALLTALAAMAQRIAGTDGAGGGDRLDRLAARLAPGSVRRLAAMALGVTLAGTTLSPAAATPTPAPHSAAQAATLAYDAVGRPATQAAMLVAAALEAEQQARSENARRDGPTHRLAAGWSPDRPAPSNRPAVAGHRTREAAVPLLTPPPRVPPDGADVVVVRRGDTLWDIAARALGAGATEADIAASWPRWHHANRHTIGADPDLLRPGQRLRPPTTPAPH
jgi:nucleoid-associated protein YgaU